MPLARQGLSPYVALTTVLQCDRAQAQQRIDTAVASFLRTTSVLSSCVPIRYTDDTSFGTGAIMAFFRALCAQWLTAHTDIPPAVAAEARALAEGARAPSYYRLLETCWRLVLALCAEFDEPPLPMSVGCAIGIVTIMACCGYALGYIRNVRTAIRFVHHYANLPVPVEDERFTLFYECVARALGDAHPHAKLALSVEQLRTIGQVIAGADDPKQIQEWAILTLTYFSVLRRQTVSELSRGAVQPVGAGLRIFVPRGKTDQHGRGHEVFIDAFPEDPAICPIRALNRWRALLPDDPDKPLFCHFGRLGMPTDRPLADRTIARICKHYVARIGLNPRDYAANSLRAGFITEALLRNVPMAAVAGHSGHRSLESLFRYFRPGAELRIGLVRAVLTTPPPSILSEFNG